MKDSTSYLIEIVRYYLKAYKIVFDDAELYKVLMSDPTFPSLASICRTLEYYGISAEAFQSDKTNTEQLKNSIIHTSIHDGHFLVVVNMEGNEVTLFDSQHYKVSKDQFLKLWDGIVLKINKPNTNNENVRLLRVNIHKVLINKIVILFVVACVVFSVSLAHSLLTGGTFLLDIIGAFLCSQLIKRRMGFPERDKFCRIGKRIDCDYVSSKQPLAGVLPFNLEDAGLFYFLWDILIVLMDGPKTPVFAVSLLTTILSFFLAAYQILAIRKYCIYCFCLYTVFITKAIVSYFALDHFPVFHIIEALAFNLMAAIIAILLCVAFSRLEKTKRQALNNDVRLLKIKREPKVFHALSVRMPMLNFQNLTGLKYGKEKVDSKIVIFVSLNCKYCRQAIKDASTLLTRFPNRFNCTVILTDIENNSKNKNLALIDEYLQGDHDISSLIKNKNHKEKGKSSQLSRNLFNEMEREAKDFSIVKFPFIVIDGAIKPKLYEISDYQYIYSGVYM